MRKLGVVLIALFLVQVTKAQIDLESNKEGFWPFNGNASEIYFDVLNGQISGAVPTLDRFGFETAAYLFDGVNDEIVFEEPLLPTDGSDWTMSMWFQPGNLTDANHEVIYSQYEERKSNRFHLYVMNGNLYVFYNSNSTVGLQPTIIAENITSDWHLVQLTSVGGKVNIYFNGGLKIENMNIPIIRNIYSVVGNDISNKFRYFQGAIDDLKIYHRALSELELKYLQYDYPKSCKETVYETVQDTLEIEIRIVTNTLSFQGVSQIKVYPNPSSTHVDFDFGPALIDAGYMFKIVNDIGIIEYEDDILTDFLSVDLSHFSGGELYFISFYDSQGKLLETKKLLIK